MDFLQTLGLCIFGIGIVISVMAMVLTMYGDELLQTPEYRMPDGVVCEYKSSQDYVLFFGCENGKQYLNPETHTVIEKGSEAQNGTVYS